MGSLYFVYWKTAECHFIASAWLLLRTYAKKSSGVIFQYGSEDLLLGWRFHTFEARAGLRHITQTSNRPTLEPHLFHPKKGCQWDVQ